MLQTIFIYFNKYIYSLFKKVIIITLLILDFKDSYYINHKMILKLKMRIY